MLFHTWTFLAFFAIVYPIYLAIKGTRLRLPWLLLSSYVFYGWWNPVYLLLVAGATVVDWLRAQTKLPVLTNLPFGHVPTKVLLPVGAKVDLVLQGQEALMAWGHL